MEDDRISAVEEDGLEQRHHSPRGVVPCRQKAKLAQPAQNSDINQSIE